jgi:hypothetical protein
MQPETRFYQLIQKGGLQVAFLFGDKYALSGNSESTFQQQRY